MNDGSVVVLVGLGYVGSPPDGTGEVRGEYGRHYHQTTDNIENHESFVGANMVAQMRELEHRRAAAEAISGKAASWWPVRERPAAITACNSGFSVGG